MRSAASQSRLVGAAGTSLRREDKVWGLIWIGGIALLWIWDAAFLNPPAFQKIQTAMVNTMIGGILVVLFTLLLGWSVGVAITFAETKRNRIPFLSLTFLVNLVRSIPQMVGILMGYMILTVLIQREVLQSQLYQILWTSLTISIFTFPELVDLIRERIEFFRKSDFFSAMLCSGIAERRIINVDVLWKNSLEHIVQKLVSTFGMAVFLQCSIDFIISVGLSTDVSLSNFPETLGGLLATLDSKQDILAISMLFTDIGYAHHLLFRHLQGISVAFLIVFTLLCVYKVANGLMRRYNL
jgi:ABC-type amino acid transport system permease subunit